MITRKSLPLGREHELKLGVTAIGSEESLLKIPKLDFFESMRQVMKTELVMVENGAETDIYDPTNPTWDESPILFHAVRRHLPKRPKGSLRLYNANKTSLDIYHGVDVFFWWREVYVTIDLSLIEKPYRRTVDLVVDLTDMNFEAFDVLGAQIAEILKQKREKLKYQKQAKKSIFHI